MTILIIIILAIIGVATTLGLYTLIKSKLAIEKMVAVDVVTTITTGAMIVLALIFESIFLFDVAIVYAILSFGAVFVVARYREGGF